MERSSEGGCRCCKVPGSTRDLVDLDPNPKLCRVPCREGVDCAGRHPPPRLAKCCISKRQSLLKQRLLWNGVSSPSPRVRSRSGQGAMKQCCHWVRAGPHNLCGPSRTLTAACDSPTQAAVGPATQNQFWAKTGHSMSRCLIAHVWAKQVAEA